MNIPLFLLMQNTIQRKQKKYQEQNEEKSEQNIKPTQEDFYNNEQLSL